jgi:hypothetical protein
VADAPSNTAAVSSAPVAATSAVVASSVEAPAEASASDLTAASGSGTKAAAPSASAPAASATGSTSSGSGNAAAGSGPVGTGWDPAKNKASISSYVDAGLQWFTNWSPSSKEYPAIEFVPMVWGSGSVPDLKAAMGGWPSSTKYVLSFNERE